MRYDTPVYFQKITSGPYDPATGNHGPDTVVEDKRMASVTSTGMETMNLIYGQIRQGSLTIRLQNHYEKPFDRIRVGKKVYRVDSARPLRLKYNFVVSEDL